jgi:hypothetical protein
MDEITPSDSTMRATRLVQAHLADLAERARRDRIAYLFSEHTLYEASTREPDAVWRAEPPCRPGAYDRVIARLHEPRFPQIQTMNDAKRASMTRFHDASFRGRRPMKFQGDNPDAIEGRFVHVFTGRGSLDAPAEDAVLHVYLNPRADYSADVVEMLVDGAETSEVPLNFTFVNLDGATNRRTLERNDRIVVRVSARQRRTVDQLVEQIARQYPDAFAGRSVPFYANELSAGIGRAHDPTRMQAERHGTPKPTSEQRPGSTRETSAGALRSKMLDEAIVGVVSNLVTSPALSSAVVAHKSVRDHFAEALGSMLNIRIPRSDPELTHLLTTGLTSAGMQQAGVGPETEHAVEDALRHIARRVLPNIQTDDLAVSLQLHLDALQSKYGVNSRNLGDNARLDVARIERAAGRDNASR